MGKKTGLLVGLLILLSLALIGCGNQPTAPVLETETQVQSVTVFDKEGTRIEVPQPVEKVISVNSGMTSLICALGAGDKLVGRDTNSTFPVYAREQVEVVAESSANCNLEVIISKVPNLVMADTMFYPQHREKLAVAGIPSYVDSTSDPERLLTLIRSTGLMLGENEKAEEIVQFITHYTDIVDQRINRLNLENGEKPLVFFEWHSTLETANAETVFHKPIVQAGGINIAAGLPIRTPEMSSEWVIQQNPDVIINRVSGDATLEQMQQKYAEIINRPGWDHIAAVQNKRVYIIKSDVFLTFRYPVGLLYYATWFHPELFEDMNPEAVHQEIIETFFSEEEWETLQKHETFVYWES